ncbi:aldo-keto reductase family 1 member B1-like [Diorhabda sublineata]|uniref:aldo-keto reductase family 1 member B1-like n=1 Tax=Diorhabda sublineata TaxID=1163346 RepID=UPI0024E17A14|nr:aldo-keto reductase family 1 member B1-like [Diorhabda sublineata]
MKKLPKLSKKVCINTKKVPVTLPKCPPPVLTLNNGIKMPSFGLGTWLAPPGEVGEVVKQAIEVGYRLFDCAWLYSNEKEIGEGLRSKISEGSVYREDLFICTKLWNTFHEQEKVVPACRASLKNFGLDYLDLYLIHFPTAQKGRRVNPKLPFKNAENLDYDYVKTWKGMEECVKLGLTKSIGISNFNSQQVLRVLDNCDITPVINQIEVTPFLPQHKLIKFCKSHFIEIMGYSPLGSPARPWAKPDDKMLSLEDPTLINIGERYKKSGSQVVLRYVFQLGTIPIPKTSNLQRLKHNISIFDFELDHNEMCAINQAFKNGVRVCHAEELKDNIHYPFHLVEE